MVVSNIIFLVIVVCILLLARKTYSIIGLRGRLHVDNVPKVKILHEITSGQKDDFSGRLFDVLLKIPCIFQAWFQLIVQKQSKIQ